MSAITNTFTTSSQIGIREQLNDLINNISPVDVPFQNSIRKGKVMNTKFEWQTDSLASAANNKVNEGDDYTSTATAVTATARANNYCQISKKDFTISATSQAVKTAGRSNEAAYQITKKTKELKRDIEFAITQNGTLSTSDPRQTRGLAGWIATNCGVGAGAGAAPVPGSNTAPVAGTSRAFTESLLKTQIQNAFTQGGNPSILMVGAAQKQVVSTFTGNATRMDDSSDKTVYASVDVYVSDFGKLKVVPNRFQETTTAFGIDTNYWRLNYLRPIQASQLAKTGDGVRYLINCEYGLEAGQEAASFQIRDLA